MLIRKIKTFFMLENRKKIRFVQAFIYTGIIRAFIVFVPFNKLSKKMGNHKDESSNDVDINSYRIAKETSWAVNQAAGQTPWESKCLVQALTAQKILRRKGVPSTLYLGVKKNKDNEMVAHAWLRCGSYYVTGGYNRREYAVVAKFAS